MDFSTQWQTQLKQQKDAERKAKTASTEALRTHHSAGLSEEERKRAALREEERRQKEASSKLLTSYRGGVKEDDLKLSALRALERQHQLEAQEQLHAYRKGELSEDELKALRAKQEAALAAAAQAVDHPAPVNSEHNDDDVHITEGSVSNLASQFTGMGSPTMGSPSTSSKKVAVAPDGVMPPGVAAPIADDKATTDVGETVEQLDAAANVANAVVVEDEKKTSEESTIITPTTSSIIDDDGAGAQDNKRQVVQDQSEGDNGGVPLHDHPTVVRLDVLFSFGLVTKNKNDQDVEEQKRRQEESLAGYLQAVEEIVVECLSGGNADTKLKEHATYDAHYPPFIKDQLWDDKYVDPQNRPYVKRMVVVAAVPVFLSNGISIKCARKAVIRALQTAITSGRFLRLATGKEDGDNVEDGQLVVE